MMLFFLACPGYSIQSLSDLLDHSVHLHVSHHRQGIVVPDICWDILVMAMLATLTARFILSAGCVSCEFIMLSTMTLAASSICPMDFVRDAQQIFFQLLLLQ